jgi:hypothetical protein
MAVKKVPLRDWHRLFGLLLADFFTDSPFTVEIERDLSKQQQLLDVIILRRKPGRMSERLPDGLDDLAAHNLITFKSHRESLDAWTMKELIGHYVAYRKLVCQSPTKLLPESEFRLYAISARFPDRLSGQVPWQERQPGVYDCRWGTDDVRVVVAGQLPREKHNAPLHLFSASPELLNFSQGVYRRHSPETSMLVGQLIDGFRKENFAMSFTMADFKRQFFKENFPKLTQQERQELLGSLSVAELLADRSEEQIRQYLDQMTGSKRTENRKPRRKS